MQYEYDHRAGGRQAGYPQMSWGQNYRLPANGVMWTLFFAGEAFAPSATVEGRSVQRYLQDHYLGSMRAVAERVADLDNVVGFDTLNEPGSGWIGQGMTDRGRTLSGPAFAPLDALAVAAGIPRTLPVMEFGRGAVGERRVNPDGVSIWLPGRADPFRAAGAWDVDAGGEPVAPQPDFFRVAGGREVEVERDFMAPFFARVATTVRAVRPDWLLFAEVDPFAALRGGHGFPESTPERTVNASHWYDLGALVTKRFDEAAHADVLTGRHLSGRAEIEAAYVEGLSRLKAIGDGLDGGAPTLVGECGIPYDMNGAEAYRRWAEGERSPAVWAAQATALELMYNALDRLLLSSTQWNYTASNRNDPMVGDGWNQEDLSIWSADQATDEGDPNSGGRAVEGFCRPYVRAAQGRLIAQGFDRASGVFEAVIEPDPTIEAPTEIYVPEAQYPNGYTIRVGAPALVAQGHQILTLKTLDDEPLVVRIERRSAPTPSAG